MRSSSPPKGQLGKASKSARGLADWDLQLGLANPASRGCLGSAGSTRRPIHAACLPHQARNDAPRRGERGRAQLLDRAALYRELSAECCKLCLEPANSAHLQDPAAHQVSWDAHNAERSARTSQEGHRSLKEGWRSPHAG